MKQKYTNDKYEVLTFRLCKEDKEVIESKALAFGFTSLSDYLRVIALNAELVVNLEK